MHKLEESLKKRFDQHVDRGRAEKMEAYMKLRFSFYGIPSPLRKTLLRESIAEIGKPDLSSSFEIAASWYKEPKRELHYCAIELIGKHSKQLKPDHLPLLERFVLTHSWWDTVDYIAPNLIGPILKIDQNLRHQMSWKWAKSNELWLQRTALLFQLKYKTETDDKLLYDLIDLLHEHPDFFIRKAIGWSLRQHAKLFPESVIAFVDSRDLSPLSKREALKHLY